MLCMHLFAHTHSNTVSQQSLETEPDKQDCLLSETNYRRRRLAPSLSNWVSGPDRKKRVREKLGEEFIFSSQKWDEILQRIF